MSLTAHRHWREPRQKPWPSPQEINQAVDKQRKGLATASREGTNLMHEEVGELVASALSLASVDGITRAWEDAKAALRPKRQYPSGICKEACNTRFEGQTQS